MKATKRLIMFVLVLAMAVSMLALPAMANSGDTTFTFKTTTSGTFEDAEPEHGRLKENSTPVYVYQKSGSSSIRVQARASTSKN